MVDDRQVVVRVDGRVAVAREVLRARGDTAVLQAPDHGRAKPADEVGVVAERAVADHRVLRVGVDVDARARSRS